MALFQYFFQVLYQLLDTPSGFSEWRLIFAYQLFVLSLLTPFFSIGEMDEHASAINRIFNTCIRAFIVVLSLSFFRLATIFSEIYIDSFVSISAAVAFAHAVNQREPAKYRNTSVFLTCAILVLAKDVGLFYAVFAVLANCVTQFYGNSAILSSSNAERSHSPKVNNVLFLLMSVCCVALPKLLWTLKIRIDNANISFNAPYDLGVLIDIIIGKDTGYRSQVIPGFFEKIFTDRYTVGDYALPFMVVLVLLFVGLICAIPRVNAQSCNRFTQTNRAYILILIAMSALYLIGLPITYIFQFSPHEAVQHASLGRYAGILSSSLWLIFVLCYISSEELHKSGRNHLVIFSVFMFLCANRVVLGSYFERYYVQENLAEREVYDNISNLIHNDAGDRDADIQVIAQETTGYTMYLSSYLLRPYNVSRTWSIGEEPLYEGDLWTTIISPDEWKQQILSKYDYVVIYESDEYFIETYSDFFVGGIENNSVYKVDIESGACQMMPLFS